MELQQNNNGTHVQNGTAKEPIKPTNGAAKTAATNGKAEAKAKPVAEKETKQVPQNGQDTPEVPKPEVVHVVKEETAIAPAMNLESKLKVVDDLHRKSVQRLNLIRRKGELEAFGVKLETENDELSDNPYQGCKLIIEDDKRRQFITTTPGLVRLVSQFIFNACDEKLKEIEASIVFPAL